MPRLLILTTIPVSLLAFHPPFGRHFRSLGWRVDAAARGLTAHAGELEGVFDGVYDLPWSRSIIGAANYTRAASALRELVAAGDYDLVHVHTPIAGFLTRWALRKAGGRPKVVYTAHGFHFGHSTRPPYLNPFFHCEKAAGRWTDALVVINQDDYRLAQRHRFVPEGRLHYMPGIGVDLSYYSREKIPGEQITQTRAALALQPDDFLGLMIAEFNPGKRHADLLRAMQGVDSRVHMAFAGEGRLWEETKALAQTLGLASRTHFLGYRKDIPLLVAAADASILPSEREGLPRSIMEAMAMGTPVLGSRIRGITELLEDDCGLMFEPGNIGEIRACLQKAAAEPRLLSTLAANGRQKVVKYSLDRVKHEHEQLYSALLNS